MAMTNLPVFTQSPIVGIATLTAPTAVTTRTNITGTTGLTQLTIASTNGTRIDNIRVKCKGTNVITTVFLWIFNGTTSFLYDEIDLSSAVTASNTVDSFKVDFGTSLNLPATYQLWISTTVAQDMNVFAQGGVY